MKFVVNRWTKNKETGEIKDTVFHTGYKTINDARLDSIRLNSYRENCSVEYYYPDIPDLFK